jgi:hypothetical protein
VRGKQRISFVSPWFVIHLNSDLKFPCPNLSVDKQFYLKKKKRTLEYLCFLKCTSYLYKI